MPEKARKAIQSHKRQRFEVLLEAMQDDVKRVAEGHSNLTYLLGSVGRQIEAVDRRINQTQQALMEAVRELKQQIGELQQAVLELRAEVRIIGERLDVHLAQAHAT